MNCTAMVILRYFFNLACFAVAFGMTVVWLFTYLENEDSVKVYLKALDFLEGQYPMISFCLRDPFIESELKRYNETLTGLMYKRFLSGKSFSKYMKDINFDDVTLNLADFYLVSFVRFRNGSQVHRFYFLPQATVSGFRNGIFFKCFGLHSKFANIDLISFRFNSSLYPGGIRPSRPFFFALLHLPNQISLAKNFGKNTWPKRIEKKGHIMSFKLQQLEVLKRRNKRNDHCVPNELNFDQMILDDYLDKLGCKAPYHRTDKNLEVCDSILNMKKANFDHLGNENPKKACTSVSIITFTYDEHDKKGNDKFSILIEYPSQYKEVVMVRAVDLQTVIGNAGGYIGLFLGKISWMLLKLTIIE